MASSKQPCHLGLRSAKTLQADETMVGNAFLRRLVPSFLCSCTCLVFAIGPGSLGLGLGLQLQVTHWTWNCCLEPAGKQRSRAHAANHVPGEKCASVTGRCKLLEV